MGELYDYNVTEGRIITGAGATITVIIALGLLGGAVVVWKRRQEYKRVLRNREANLVYENYSSRLRQRRRRDERTNPDESYEMTMPDPEQNPSPYPAPRANVTND